MKSYRVITRSYKREREGVGTNTNNDDITNGYEREREGKRRNERE